MSTVNVDQSLIDAYRVASAKVAEAETELKAIRTVIEVLIGDNECAAVDGIPVIRWSHISSRRLDVNRLRERVDPAILADCYVETHSRQFRLLKEATHA